jgi:hypothetical protein
MPLSKLGNNGRSVAPLFWPDNPQVIPLFSAQRYSHSALGYCTNSGTGASVEQHLQSLRQVQAGEQVPASRHFSSENSPGEPGTLDQFDRHRLDDAMSGNLGRYLINASNSVPGSSIYRPTVFLHRMSFRSNVTLAKLRPCFHGEHLLLDANLNTFTNLPPRRIRVDKYFRTLSNLSSP